MKSLSRVDPERWGCRACAARHSRGRSAGHAECPSPPDRVIGGTAARKGRQPWRDDNRVARPTSACNPSAQSARHVQAGVLGRPACLEHLALRPETPPNPGEDCPLQRRRRPCRGARRGRACASVLWHVHDFLSRRSLARCASGPGGWQGCRGDRDLKCRRRGLAVMACAVKVHTVANAIDTQQFCPGPADGVLLDRLAKRLAAPVCALAWLATYARWKGHEVFLRAAARVLNRRPDVAVRFFVIVDRFTQTQGSQFNRAELQALTAQLKIAADVGFIDFSTMSARSIVPSMSSSTPALPRSHSARRSSKPWRAANRWWSPRGRGRQNHHSR